MRRPCASRSPTRSSGCAPRQPRPCATPATSPCGWSPRPRSRPTSCGPRPATSSPTRSPRRPSLRSRRDEITAELTQLSGVIDALSVPEEQPRRPATTTMRSSHDRDRPPLPRCDAGVRLGRSRPGHRRAPESRSAARSRRPPPDRAAPPVRSRDGSRRAGDSCPAASFEHLGERVGQILGLAEQEAAELRDQATAEVETLRKDAEQAAVASSRSRRRVRRAASS